MQIGILGTGRMGVRLAAMFADRGHAVVLGSRDLSRAERIVSGLRRTNITAGSYEQAANAPIVLPAMFIRDGLFDQLEPLRPALRGKLLIDISNPFNDDYSDFILPWDTSGAEQIQARLPETRVVGAFKNVWWEVFDAPRFGDTLSDVFVVGDDAEAKQSLFRTNARHAFPLHRRGQSEECPHHREDDSAQWRDGTALRLLSPHELQVAGRPVAAGKC